MLATSKASALHFILLRGSLLSHMSEITELLSRAAGGDNAATNQLMPIIYERLCRIAHRQLEF